MSMKLQAYALLALCIFGADLVYASCHHKHSKRHSVVQKQTKRLATKSNKIPSIRLKMPDNLSLVDQGAYKITRLFLDIDSKYARTEFEAYFSRTLSWKCYCAMLSYLAAKDKAYKYAVKLFDELSDASNAFYLDSELLNKHPKLFPAARTLAQSYTGKELIDIFDKRIALNGKCSCSPKGILEALELFEP